MSDEKLALVLFDIGFVLMMISMVIGPFGITNWALTTAVIACCLALGAMAIAFQGWDVPADMPPENPSANKLPSTEKEENTKRT